MILIVRIIIQVCWDCCCIEMSPSLWCVCVGLVCGAINYYLCGRFRIDIINSDVNSIF